MTSRSRSVIELPTGVGIVLDLDDTLYPERSFHDSGFRWIAERTGLDPDGAEVAGASIALRTNGRPLDILSDATGVPVATLLEWHRTHPPTITTFPDAARFLLLAAESEVPLVLLSDGRPDTQRRKIEALGIADAFRAILISEETGIDKYDIAAFEGAAAHLPDATSYVYFGDNPKKDIAGPRALGWLVFLMVDRGDTVHRQDLGVAEATLVRSFDEVSLPNTGGRPMP
jgi:putative hydrolase of the HAD superfamily